MNIDTFEKYPLTFGVTPIEFLPRLSKSLGDRVKIFAKRDDCNSGLAAGGSKLRKLEYIVPDILTSKADTLVSIGGVQSNHTRQVAATAAKLGLHCLTIQESWVDHPDPTYDRVGNILLSKIMGAETKMVESGFDINEQVSCQDAIKQVEDAGGKPYFIPAGASMHKFGGLGYTAFAREVEAQEQQLGVKFDWIIVCVVTGSTHGGMVVGFAEQNRAHTVIGIDASAEPEKTRSQVRDIVSHTADLVQLGRTISDDEIVINPSYAYPAYGIPSKETQEAIRLAAQTEALITDPVYEGKSMQGLIDLVRTEKIPAGSNVLYVHLGGVPAINGYSGYFPNG